MTIYTTTLFITGGAAALYIIADSLARHAPAVVALRALSHDMRALVIHYRTSLED